MLAIERGEKRGIRKGKKGGGERKRERERERERRSRGKENEKEITRGETTRIGEVNGLL